MRDTHQTKHNNTQPTKQPTNRLTIWCQGRCSGQAKAKPNCDKQDKKRLPGPPPWFRGPFDRHLGEPSFFQIARNVAMPVLFQKEYGKATPQPQTKRQEPALPLHALLAAHHLAALKSAQHRKGKPPNMGVPFLGDPPLKWWFSSTPTPHPPKKGKNRNLAFLLASLENKNGLNQTKNYSCKRPQTAVKK